MHWGRVVGALLSGTVAAGCGPALAQFQGGGLAPVAAEDVAALDRELAAMRGAGWTAEQMDLGLRRDGYVVDRAVLDGEVTVEDGWVRGMVLDASGSTGAGAARPAPRRPTPFEQGLSGVAGNVGNTDEDIRRAAEGREAMAWARLDRLLSGRGITSRANQAVDGATGAVTRPIREAIDGAADAVMQPVEDAVDDVGQSITCSLGSAAIGGAVSLVSGIFSMGKATLGAQIAQYLTELGGNLCLGKQLSTQRRQLSVQQRMVAPLGRDAVAGAGEVGSAVLDSLGLLGADEVGRGYQDGASADLDPASSLAVHQGLRARTDRARRDALATAALNVEAERVYSGMADRALDLSRGARGQTSAIQALAQMERAKEGAAAARNASRVAFDTAALVAEEEARAGERLAAARRARFYSGLGGPARDAGAPGLDLFQ